MTDPRSAIIGDIDTGLAKFLELWTKHRGEPDEPTRAALSEAFQQGVTWGITCVMKQAMRSLDGQGTSSPVPSEPVAFRAWLDSLGGHG